MRVDVPECGGEQGPDEEGTKSDAQHGGQDEGFACAVKGGTAAVSTAASILAPAWVPYPAMLARSTGFGGSLSSATSLNLSLLV